MGGEVRQQPELRTRQAHRPGAGRPGGRRHAVAQLPRFVDQRAHVRTELEHPLGLGENRAGRAGIGQCEMGACELEPDLDGQPGNTVVEQGPQTVRARQRRAGIFRSRLVECDARRRHVHDRARRVVAEARLRRRALLPPVRVPLPRPRLPAGPREARAVPVRRRRRPRRRTASPSSTVAARSSVARSVAPSSACATPRMRSAAGIQSLSGWNWFSARSASASACSTPSRIM